MLQRLEDGRSSGVPLHVPRYPSAAAPPLFERLEAPLASQLTSQKKMGGAAGCHLMSRAIRLPLLRPYLNAWRHLSPRNSRLRPLPRFTAPPLRPLPRFTAPTLPRFTAPTKRASAPRASRLPAPARCSSAHRSGQRRRVTSRQQRHSGTPPGPGHLAGANVHR